MHAAGPRQRLGPWPAAIAAGGAAGLVLAAGSPYSTLLAGFVVAVLMAVALGFLAWRTDPAWLMTGALIASSFNGNWAELGVPGGIAPDRLLLLAAIGGLLLRSPAARDRPRFRLHAVHALLALTLFWAIGSAIGAGTLGRSETIFFIADRLAVPFLVFALAPLTFRTARHRNGFLAGLVAFGGYLGLTALFETVGPDALVLPGFINDVGFQTDRAQGPFLEATVNGVALYTCCVAAAIAVATWRGRARVFAAVVLLLCTPGLLFTLTRSVWIASVAATLLTFALVPRLRSLLVPVAVGAAALVLLLLALFPKLDTSVSERSGNRLTVWERQYVNAAAVEMVHQRPLVGYGLGTFNDRNAEHFPLLEDVPQVVTVPTTQIDIHNVFLLFAVEQGLVGAALLVASLIAVVATALIARGPPELVPWRIGLFAIAVYWIVAANFAPLGQVLPNLIVWLWAGIVLGGTAGWAEPVRGPQPARAEGS